MNPILSIIIVNYNTRELLTEAIKSILRYDKRLDFSGKVLSYKEEERIPAEIIVVDNGSKDGFVEEIKSLRSKLGIKRLRIIENRENLGFGKANNQGMNAAQGQYFLLLNSDTLVKEGAISQTLFWLSSHPEYDLVGCRLINEDGSIQPSVGKFLSLKNVFSMLFLDRFFKRETIMSSPCKIKKVDWIKGAFMLLRKEIFEKSGGFDEEIFMYMEEVEWCYRLSKLGFTIGFYPEAKIVHLGGKSSPGRTDPIIFIFKGLIHFYQKHMNKLELFFLRKMLFVKAAISFLLGILTGNNYLKKTYGEAIKLV